MNQSYAAIIFLTAGMILMFGGFFMYISDESEIISVGVVLFGALCECLGFFLAYLGYKSATKFIWKGKKLIYRRALVTTLQERLHDSSE